MERKEKIKELVLKQKINSEKQSVIRRYKERINVDLDSSSFVEMELSNEIKSASYQKIFSLDNKEFDQIEDIIKMINKIERNNRDKLLNSIIFYNLNVFNIIELALGCRVTLDEALQLIKLSIDKICKGDLQADIIVVDENLEYGFCVEVEEYSYLFTSWNL
ncbi:hypothetical protein J2Z48_003201 [Croceifilum oryzae]|uniref:Uncharacterized protein n=1 Tax=Croceifilum oryzae TaxID=1553429 RepID=A0AAJ1WRX5_9BACL|nr:hypothetical protein [Croceifilum oryzae]MDQ0418977.1 hypothetical protein [Croceifilum oryzae]